MKKLPSYVKSVSVQWNEKHKITKHKRRSWIPEDSIQVKRRSRASRQDLKIEKKTLETHEVINGRNAEVAVERKVSPLGQHQRASERIKNERATPTGTDPGLFWTCPIDTWPLLSSGFTSYRPGFGLHGELV